MYLYLSVLPNRGLGLRRSRAERRTRKSYNWFGDLGHRRMSLTSFVMPLKVAAAVCLRRVCGLTVPSDSNARHRSSIPTRSPSIKVRHEQQRRRPGDLRERHGGCGYGGEERNHLQERPPRRPAIEEHVRPQHVEQELRPEKGPRGSLRSTVLASLLGQPQRGAHEGVQQRPCGAEVGAGRSKGGLSQRRAPFREALARQEDADPSRGLARHHRAYKLGYRAPVGHPQLT